jgi:hypothetical protein
MGRDCASKRVAIALAEADQRTSGRGHQRRLTSPPLPSRGARRSAETGKIQRCSRAGRRPSQPFQPVWRDVRQTPAPPLPHGLIAGAPRRPALGALSPLHSMLPARIDRPVDKRRASHWRPPASAPSRCCACPRTVAHAQIQKQSTASRMSSQMNRTANMRWKIIVARWSR